MFFILIFFVGTPCFFYVLLLMYCCRYPDRVMFCVMPVNKDGDDSSDIQHVLLKAYCSEQHIRIIYVSTTVLGIHNFSKRGRIFQHVFFFNFTCKFLTFVRKIKEVQLQELWCTTGTHCRGRTHTPWAELHIWKSQELGPWKTLPWQPQSSPYSSWTRRKTWFQRNHN